MKTLQQSWLHGEISPTSKARHTLGAILLARLYFQGWTEREVRKLWHELNKLILEFIKKSGKKSNITNPITILHDQLIMNFDTYKNFMDKWILKFQNIELIKTQRVTAPEVYLAAFVLKNAAEGNVKKVLEAYSPLVNKHNTSYSLKDIKKSIISEQNKKNAQAARKSPLRKLIELFLNKNIKKSYLVILNDIKNHDGNYSLKEIDNELQLWEVSLKKKKLLQTMTKINFRKMVSDARTYLKKK